MAAHCCLVFPVNFLLSFPLNEDDDEKDNSFSDKAKTVEKSWKNT